MAKGQIFSNSDGYKFVDPSTGLVTGVLEANGRFTLKDGQSANLEVFQNWTDFVKSMGDAPVKSGDESEILTQLSNMGLGNAQLIDRTAKETKMAKTTTPAPAPKPVAKTATKTAPAAQKTASAPKAAPKPKAEVVLKPCACGCGEMVAKEFRMGHDARVHGWAKKIADGRMKMGEIPARAQQWMREHGVKQGKSAA